MFGMFLPMIISGLFNSRPVSGALSSVVNKVLSRQDVPIEQKDVPAATVKVVQAIKAEAKAQGVAVVPVKSAWLSKVNWVQFAAPAASVAAIFGLNLSADQIVSVVVGAQAVQSVLTWVFRTWFSNAVTAASVK